jgi:hypothetical protein
VTVFTGCAIPLGRTRSQSDVCKQPLHVTKPLYSHYEVCRQTQEGGGERQLAQSSWPLVSLLSIAAISRSGPDNPAAGAGRPRLHDEPYWASSGTALLLFAPAARHWRRRSGSASGSGGERAVAAARAARRAALRNRTETAHTDSGRLGPTLGPTRWRQSGGVSHPARLDTRPGIPARPRPVGQTPVRQGSPGTSLVSPGFAARSSGRRPSILRQRVCVSRRDLRLTTVRQGEQGGGRRPWYRREPGFRPEIRQCRQVIAEDCRLLGEPVPAELHPCRHRSHRRT